MAQFMGGADFVQWHGYYEIVNKLVNIKEAARTLRQNHDNALSSAAHPTTRPATNPSGYNP